MRKLSDFYKSGLTRVELIKRVSSLTFVEVGDGVYDILGYVDFSDLGLDRLLEITTLLKELASSKTPIRIRRVYGNFNCSSNYLKDLKGAPEEVEGSFDCNYNQLETLEGAPRVLSLPMRD